MKISLNSARRLALHGQGLDGRWKFPPGKEGIARTVETLGYVQIDTIAVIQRAHHHTLWTRRADYAPDMLDELQARDRRVFEYWTHAAAYVSFRDYRYYIPRMQGFARSERTRNWRKENSKLVKGVLKRIREEGPLGSADFESSQRTGPWWGWKPAKQALESLFNTGELMVTARRNFQRLYDLPERVIPEGIDTSEPTGEELERFAVRQLLSTRGVAPANPGRWGHRPAPAIENAIGELVDAGEVTCVEVEGLDAAPHYVLSENPGRRSTRRRLHLLSPFDSLIIDRNRLRKLFGFDFGIECYLPAAKRKYGYFCLPILWGTEFVGRLDPKADRKTKTFIVRKLICEPGFADFDELIPELAAKIRKFAAFNGCERVVVEETAPRKLKTPLKQALG